MNGAESRNPDADPAALAERIATVLRTTHRTAAAAESLTGGSVASRLSAAPGASEWFRGGIVAYTEEVQFSVLDVTPGPVITAECALQMAAGAVRVLGADVAVATTGAGGPGPQEDRPAGTVFIAVTAGTDRSVCEYHFDGDPGEIVAAATAQALADLAELVDRGGL